MIFEVQLRHIVGALQILSKMLPIIGRIDFDSYVLGKKVSFLGRLGGFMQEVLLCNHR